MPSFAIHRTSAPPEQILSAVRRVLKPNGSVEEAANVGVEIEELVRRALLKTSRRQLARLADDFTNPFFDHMFNPAAATRKTFAELA